MRRQRAWPSPPARCLGLACEPPVRRGFVPCPCPQFAGLPAHRPSPLAHCRFARCCLSPSPPLLLADHTVRCCSPRFAVAARPLTALRLTHRCSHYPRVIASCNCLLTATGGVLGGVQARHCQLASCGSRGRLQSAGHHCTNEIGDFLRGAGWPMSPTDKKGLHSTGYNGRLVEGRDNGCGKKSSDVFLGIKRGLHCCSLDG